MKKKRLASLFSFTRVASLVLTSGYAAAVVASDFIQPFQVSAPDSNPASAVRYGEPGGTPPVPTTAPAPEPTPTVAPAPLPAPRALSREAGADTFDGPKPHPDAPPKKRSKNSNAGRSQGGGPPAGPEAPVPPTPPELPEDWDSTPGPDGRPGSAARCGTAATRRPDAGTPDRVPRTRRRRAGATRPRTRRSPLATGRRELGRRGPHGTVSSRRGTATARGGPRPPTRR